MSFTGITSAMIAPAPAGMVAPGIDAEAEGLAARVASGMVVENDDGTVDIVLAEEEAAPEPLPWNGNLAERIPETILNTIGADLLDGIEADQESNEAYFEEVEDIIRLLGIKPEQRENKPFDDASDAVHPMMLEAVVRFVANASAEMLPAAGPARSKIEGTPSQPFEQAAQRRQRYLNYHLTTQDAGWRPDYEKGLLLLAVYGSMFRKVFRDPVTSAVRSRYLTPAHLIVSYYAPSLADALRATHVDEISGDEVRRRVASGYYRDTGNLMPAEGMETPAQRHQAAGDARLPSGRNEDAEHVHYHCHCWLTLDGTEFAEDGVALPFVVSLDAATGKVLRIEREWQEGDPERVRVSSIVHYQFHPGIGFYGWGLGHLMRNTTAQASALWRLAVDQLSLNAFPGGFRAKGTKTEDSNITVGPGEWVEVDAPNGNVRAALVSMGEVYRDVPASWQPIFASAVEQGQRLGMTTEMQVGEGRQDAPVGTTLALIEQAIRPEAAVFKRLHHGMSQELRLFCREFARDPEAEYPYTVDGQRGVAMGADFADSTDIVPVSDPNQPTQVQRLAAAQAVYQLAATTPGMMDARAALIDVLRVMGKSPQEIAALMPEAPKGEPADVVTEFAKALKGMPLAAGIEQDHAAHAQAHIAQMQTPGLPPPIVAAILAHVGEHVSLGYYLMAREAAAAQGIQIPPPGQPMPPEVEAAMARAVAANSAQITAALAQALGGGGEGANPLEAQKLALQERAQAFKEADAGRKAEESARQEMGEAQRAAMQAQGDREERAVRLEEARLELRAEELRAAAMRRGAGLAEGAVQ